MRQALFYDPDDFEVPASEQFLVIHHGEGLSRETDFGSSFSVLLSKFQIDTVSDSARFVIPASPLADLEEWQVKARRLLSWPTIPPPVDLTFPRRTWVIKEEWNQVVFVGVGENRWVLLHWYTTA